MRTGRLDRTKPAAIDEDMRQQYAKLGITVAAQAEETDAIAIMPTAWNSLITFLECQSQWRVAAGMAGLIWLGLDYPACRLVLDDMQAPAGIFSDLRYMEGAALKILNEAEA